MADTTTEQPELAVKQLARQYCLLSPSHHDRHADFPFHSDLVSQKAKTGIAHRALKPMLGICDPLNTRSAPPAVHASTGLDVLCHSLESYTAIPFSERTPRPANPILREASPQRSPTVWGGSNCF